MTLIDVELVVDKVDECFDTCDQLDLHFTAQDVIDIIKNAPTVEVEPVRHGHWTRVDYYPVGHDYICSICDRKHSSDFNFCPDCGAKMDGNEAEE